MRRAQGYCEYCRSPMRYSPDPFAVEHIVPRVAGGGNEPSNLALSCQGCNNLKFVSIEAVDPVIGVMVPLFHPRQQRWSQHFLWSQDTTVVVGRTPIGRATVERLRLNREGVVNLRRVLATIGQHPPQIKDP
jgi:HNH endonuclease